MESSIFVQNLKCGGCAHTISTKLSDIHTISNIQVNVDNSKISFAHNLDADVVLVKEKLKSLGYPSVEDDNDIMSKAKSFVSCASGKFSK